MKKAFNLMAIAAVATFAAPALNAAIYTYSVDWSNSISSSFGDVANVTDYDNTTGSTGNVNLPTLDLSILAPGETLESVTITYTAPTPPVSDTITSSLTVSTGSQNFTAVSTAATTKVSSSETATLLAAYVPQANLFKTASPYTATDSIDLTNVTVTNGTPLVGSLIRNYNVLRYTSGSPTEALLLANGGSNPFLTFAVRSEQFASFSRATTVPDVNFAFSGTDSGTITITYTTIPEPSAALLGALGVLGLLRRRR